MGQQAGTAPDPRIQVHSLCFEIYGPSYSSLDPVVYQYGETTLLPAPSTITGALIHACSISRGLSFEAALNALIGTDPIDFFVTAALPAGCMLIESPLILKRNRFLDADHIPKPRASYWEMAKERIKVSPPPSQDYYQVYQTKMFDVLRRGFVNVHKLLCLVIATDPGKLGWIQQAISCFKRLGDTESVVAAKLVESKIESVTMKSRGDSVEQVNTQAILSRAGSQTQPMFELTGGSYVIKRGMLIQALRNRDDLNQIQDQHCLMVQPLEAKLLPGQRIQAFFPSSYDIKLNSTHYVVDLDAVQQSWRVVIPIQI